MDIVATVLRLITVLATFATLVTAYSTYSTDWWWTDTSPPQPFLCGDDYEGESGVIVSPNYPDFYPSLAQCHWTVTSPYYTVIIVYVNSFETEDSFDYLEIRDGTNINAPLLTNCSGSYCHDVTSTSNSLYITFTSDYSGQDTGFRLQWYAVYPTTEAPTTDWIWTSSQPFLCGDDYGGTYGTIYSPNYPNYYPANAYCQWKVTSPDDSVITVYFESFDTERNYDYLEIRDGTYSNAPLLTHCSGGSCHGVTSTSNSLYVTFNSDGSNQESGFKLTWFAEFEGTTSKEPPSPTSTGPLQCYSCINCNSVDHDTNVEASEEFLACFIAIEIGHDHVIRGASSENIEDGVCRHEGDDAIFCYCTSDLCNNDAAYYFITQSILNQISY